MRGTPDTKKAEQQPLLATAELGRYRGLMVCPRNFRIGYEELVMQA